MTPHVVYVPGHYARTVTDEDHSFRTPRGYISDRGIQSHRVISRPPTDWIGHGLLAVIAVGALGIIADGATLLLIAWMGR